MSWGPDVPFNDLPPLPPADLDLEPKPVLKATVQARTALATLAQAGQLLPNPNILIHAVPLLEAQASSEIENIVTTADELFKHADSGGGDHATKETLRYRSALFAGAESIRSHPHVPGEHCRASSCRHPGWPGRTVLGRPVRATLRLVRQRDFVSPVECPRRPTRPSSKGHVAPGSRKPTSKNAGHTTLNPGEDERHGSTGEAPPGVA